MRILLLIVATTFLFAQNVLATVDTTIGISAPRSMTKDYKVLAHYLCDAEADERAKANAIYNWITHNIRYDVKALQTGKIKPSKVEKVLKNRIGVCEGYAKLFTAMCQEVGLKAMNIDGYAKDWMFDNGTRVYLPRHMWCAVQVNGSWQFADPTWGAGNMVQAPLWWQAVINKVLRRKVSYSKRMKFRLRYDSSYCMQDPEAFRLKHLPADPIWQLTDTSMPLGFFESGDSAVVYFNEHYSQPKQQNADLVRISDLADDKATMEAVDREYSFNNRYIFSLAMKQSLQANSNIEKILADSTGTSGETLLKEAVNALKKSEDHVKAQKKYFPEEYSELKKKNRDKNIEAKKYINKIKADDKKLVSQCNMHRKATSLKAKKVSKNYGLAAARKRELDINRLANQEPSKIQKQETDPAMRELADSIAVRNKRLDTLQVALRAKEARIQGIQAANQVRLDTLIAALTATDSFLINETTYRLAMKDNCDDEIKLWSGLFKEKKFREADTLHKYYMANYDTVIALYDDAQKTRVIQFNTYKKNMHDIEKYGKLNKNADAILSTYPELVTNYTSTIDSGNSTLMTANAYLKMNKKLFAGLAKVYKRQLMLAEYMNKAETMRKKIEQATIANRQAFDNSENKKQIAKIKSSIKKLESIN